MASRGLGTLTLDLVARIAGFEQGMDKAARHADKRLRGIEDRASKFGKVLGGALAAGAGAALAGLITVTKQAIDSADRINDMSQRLGVSTEALSAWGYAAQQSGTDIEALSGGLTKFTKNVAAAMDAGSRQGEIFAALGIKVKDAAGNLRSVEDLLPEIATAFKGMNNATLESALSMELFGKSGAQLLQFLNLGGEGLDSMAEKARSLGIIISKDAAQAADDFNDGLADLKAIAGGVGIQLAEKLLPTLLDLIDYLKRSATEGGLLETVIDGIGNAAARQSQVLADIGKDVENLTRAWEVLRLVNSAAANAMTLNFTQSSADWKRAMELREEAINPAPRRTGPVPNVAVPFLQPLFPQFSAVPTSPLRQDGAANATEQRLNQLLTNTPDAKKTKGKKEGKSDAEKEAERLLAAYERMQASLREQATLIGEVSEVEKLRYELANGELSKLTEKQKESLLADATALDQARERYKLEQDGKALVESLMTPTEQINELRDEAAKLLEAGAISMASYTRAIESYLTPAQEVINGLREEIELLGLSDIAQQKLIATRQAGTDATAEQIAEIERLIEVRAQAAQAADFQRQFEEGLADAIFDVATGAKSASDAAKDFFDDLAKYITRMIAEQWAKKIGEMFAGGSGGEGGGGGTNWFSAIMGALGGGKAAGGPVSPGTMYRVNENGTELLSIGGKDYLMMGSQAGHITPNHELATASGGGNTYNFAFAAPTELRTQQQVATRVAYETRRAAARN